jgi:hypothetical protein
MGATLLRAAIEWDYLSRQGLRDTALMADLRRSLPGLSAEMAQELDGLQVVDTDKGVEVRPEALQEGMVLASDIVTAGGTMLVVKGRRITSAVIEKLRCYPGAREELRTIRVSRASIASSSELLHA